MTDVLPSIEKTETKQGINGMILETKCVKVQGEKLEDVKRIFDEEWEK